MLSKIGGRKMFITIVALIAGIVIDLQTERGLSQNLLYLMMFIIGAYSTANVVTKSKTTAKSEDNTTELMSKIQVNQEQYEQYLSGLANVVENVQKQVDTNNKRLLAFINKGE